MGYINWNKTMALTFTPLTIEGNEVSLLFIWILLLVTAPDLLQIEGYSVETWGKTKRIVFLYSRPE